MCMCVEDNELREQMNKGLQALRDEVEAKGTEVDKECLRYVLDQEADSSEKAFQGGRKRDCDESGNVLPKPARQMPRRLCGGSECQNG